MKKSILLICSIAFILAPVYSQGYGSYNEPIPSTLIFAGIWILMSVIVGAFGSSRKIGFLETFGISIILSPLIGAICMATSKKDDEWQLQVAMHDMLKQIQITLAPKPEIKKEVNPVNDIDYTKIPIVEREELMEKYGITFNKWNEKYKYHDFEYSNFNDAIKYAMTQSTK